MSNNGCSGAWLDGWRQDEDDEDDDEEEEEEEEANNGTKQVMSLLDASKEWMCSGRRQPPMSDNHSLDSGRGPSQY
jgi:hypothetical protein